MVEEECVGRRRDGTGGRGGGGGGGVGRLVGRRVVVVESGFLLVVPKEGFLLRTVLRLFEPGCFGRFFRLYGRSLLESGNGCVDASTSPGIAAVK